MINARFTLPPLICRTHNKEMKGIILITVLLFLGIKIHAQQDDQKGIITGTITDKSTQGASLPFANIFIKGSSKGTISDVDGTFSLSNVAPGVYTLVFSFMGYETLEMPNVMVIEGKATELNVALKPDAAALDEVIVSTKIKKDTEVALLLEQKKAMDIKESIGAIQLEKIGVSNAATATTKISGVTSSEASGDVFVRGLGDRYLYTTLNGLPVPSDDVNRKNIDLNLFATDIIQNVSVSKTYAPAFSADQASGTVNISTRELTSDEVLKLDAKAGINTNVMQDEVFNNFKLSANAEDISLGFYEKAVPTSRALTEQSWNTTEAELPINSEFGITAGKEFGKLGLLLTGSQATSYAYSEGIFREFQTNHLQDSISDIQEFQKLINTTALLDVNYELNENHELKFSSLFVNKLVDQVLEGGRNMQGVIFEESEPADDLSQFIRDQNTKQTRLWVNQIFGEHQLTETNELIWGVGYNDVVANEPNRIRNEVNFNENTVQLGNTGGFQQRKSVQLIEDAELNAFILDDFSLFKNEKQAYNVRVGFNYRNKDRNFYSRFYGFDEVVTNTVNPLSIDDLSAVFTQEKIDNNLLNVNILDPDRYRASLTSTAAFANFIFHFQKIHVNIGARYQADNLEVHYDVGNIPGRIGFAEKEYNNIYPALSTKYELTEKQNLRFAASKTITLPEFKEVSPFEYVSQLGQVTRGNPKLDASTNYNLDLKWEYFPTTKQLLSLTGFYKIIQDPINKVQDRGAADVYSYFNSGEKAEVFGIEMETRLNLISETDNSPYNLDLNFNAARIWHSQDLKEERDPDGSLIRTFRYKGLEEVGLQGASDWIVNASLNFFSGGENEFLASIIANYASDKIYALGAPEIQTANDVFYNDAIIEEGFVSLDALVSQGVGEHFKIKLTGKNLLNSVIKRTQKIRPSTTRIESTETVRSYSKGATISLGFSYNF